ncbi:hypothetical protein DMC16_12825 [Lacticaseibacillus paracasei]|uniref:hypothetical protein n=1 Tax=Lacticaseibacillus paracasei TaxID=1597 RepID=UPI000D767E62|nr:hypothetical protein [Lacticaseibacillus paracasei]AWR91938.1 hypothetical protein DMC16_12825 [Lacticaseibacillus paracasei]
MGLGQWFKNNWNASLILKKYKDGEKVTPEEVELFKKAYSGRTPSEQVAHEKKQQAEKNARRVARDEEILAKQEAEEQKNTTDPKWTFNANRSAYPLKLDTQRNTWRIGDHGSIYLCSDLLSFQLKENDSMIAQGTSSFGGFVGGNIAGGAAGITSSFSGKQRVNHTVSRMEIFINVKGTVRNTRTISIYKGSPLDVTSRAYRSYFKKAQGIISILDDIMRRGMSAAQ